MDNIQYSDYIVTLDHPYGKVELTLKEWSILGPDAEHNLTPSSLKEKKTEKKMPLKLIPFKYRNSFLSRLLMRFHLIPNPWKS